MRAYVFDGERGGLANVAEPLLKEDQVRLRPLAVGLCHSDLTVMARRRDEIAFPLPAVLGHEIAAEVIETNRATPEIAIGTKVVVHGPRGCTTCRACIAGRENYCPFARDRGLWPYGLGRDGGLAEQMIVDSPNDLIPLDGIVPVQAAVMADAGLTAYHAVTPETKDIDNADTLVIIGAGGVGHLAIQILRVQSHATIIVVDPRGEARELAKSLGADAVLDFDSHCARHIKEICGLAGAARIWDFVGSQQTLDLATAIAGPASRIIVSGVGEGRIAASVTTLPLGSSVRTTYWGSRKELTAVLQMVREGVLHAVTVETSLHNIDDSYAKLGGGRVTGRLVVTDFSESL